MKILRIPLVIVLFFVAGRTFNANAQTETALYSFGSSLDGSEPYAGLVRGSDSNFYGTTLFGGTNGLGGLGTVFRISPSGTYTTLYSFAGSPANDGSYPQAGLVQGSDSNFYGTTIEGGTSANCNGGCGTVFRISPSGSYTTLYSFAGSPNDGSEPYAGLVQGSDSNFYGTTKYGGTAGTGGTNGYGTVFRISPSGTHTTLYSFSGYPTDGSEPDAGLVQGSDSNFYGTTEYGGTNYDVAGLGYGTVFRISPSGTHTTLYSFSGYPTDGSEPYAGLVQGSDSNFYGTTIEGGTNANCNGGCGTVFRISPSGTHTTLYSFAGSPANDGSEPDAGLVQGSDGSFYGTTTGGGTNGHGTVFELDVGLGPICTYTLSATGTNVGAGGGSGSFNVTVGSSCVWTATSNVGWITITSPSGGIGSGNETVSYTVAANTGTSEQISTITVTGGNTLTVTEAGTSSCTYTLSKTNVTLAAKGGSKNVSVKVKGTDCSWTAVSNDPFIAITSGTNGTGKGKVVYSVPSNTNTTALVGTMTIAGQTFTVNQLKGGCTFKLSPKTGKIKAAGGSATVKVKPNFTNCTWTAVSNDSFITITDGASGVGKGTVSYTVATNATSNVLTGTMTIAGETYSVTQSAAK